MTKCQIHYRPPASPGCPDSRGRLKKRTTCPRFVSSLQRWFAVLRSKDHQRPVVDRISSFRSGCHNGIRVHLELTVLGSALPTRVARAADWSPTSV
jgi:hypothetical protein